MEYTVIGTVNRKIIYNSRSCKILFDISITSLLDLDENVELIFTKYDGTSSHFLNVLKYYALSHNTIIIFGNSITNITKCLSDGIAIEISESCITIYGEQTCIFKRDNGISPAFSSNICYNTATNEICFRPQKIYSSEMGNLISCAQQTVDFSTIYKKGRLWTKMRISTCSMVDFYLKSFNEYLQLNKIYIDCLEKILNSNKCRELDKTMIIEFYRYSPYVGYFLNVVTKKVSFKNKDAYDAITIHTSNVFNLSMADKEAMHTLNTLRELINDEHSFNDYFAHYKFVSSNENKMLFIVSLLSDIRRYAAKKIK